MPRRNCHAREQQPPARPVRKLNEKQLRSLTDFAGQHLEAHAEAIEAYKRLDDKRADVSVCVTGSEHPLTGVRFLSCGECLDVVAVRLAGLSDPAGNLAG